jgi:hypothetical protein
MGSRTAAKVSIIALMSLGSLLLWIGIPVGWLWIGSKASSTSQASIGIFMLILGGIVVSMVVVGKLLARLNRLYSSVTGETATVRVRLPWHRSLRGETDATHPRTVLDVVMVATVVVAGVAFAIWFLFFAGSSLPST